MHKFRGPRRIFLLIAAAIVAAITARSLAADVAPHVVKIRVDPQTVIAHIPDDFIGFGYETSAVAQSGYFSAKNARLVHLYRNLSAHGLIRIGGNISDHTRYEPDGQALVQNEKGVTIINKASLADLGDFARSTGWSVMWGLNLGTGSKEQAVDEAIAVEKALGPNLHSFEIGNEVDLMRRYSRHYDQYHADYVDCKAAIRERLPQAAFSGPDAAASFSFVQQFVAAEAKDMKLATHHYYRCGMSDPHATLDYLLARDVGFDHRLDSLRQLCASHNIAYRINEVNSFYGGGKPGVSDTFGSALWCLDYMFDLAARGCAGVNMETDINQHMFISSYSPIVHDANGICTARPEYYGMLAFGLAGHGDLLKTEVTKDEINIAAYTTLQKKSENRKHDELWLIVINKDSSRDATVEISLPQNVSAGAAISLRAPSIDSKTDVTLADVSVAPDGVWKFDFQMASFPNTGVVMQLNAPRGTAHLLRFALTP